MGTDAPTPAAALVSFLRLLAQHPEIPAATITDVVLFVASEKQALRFAVPSATRVELDRWAASLGCASSWRAVGVRRIGDWNCLEVEAEGQGTTVDVVVYARHQADADFLCGVETAGSSNDAGTLFGYPPCCIEAYAGYSREPATWVSQALARSGPGPYPCWANRLPIAWGGPTLVGELFPCALDCTAAAERGRVAFVHLRNFGLVRLAHATLIHTLRPVVGGTIPAPLGAARVDSVPSRLIQFVE